MLNFCRPIALASALFGFIHGQRHTYNTRGVQTATLFTISLGILKGGSRPSYRKSVAWIAPAQNLSPEERAPLGSTRLRHAVQVKSHVGAPPRVLFHVRQTHRIEPVEVWVPNDAVDHPSNSDHVTRCAGRHPNTSASDSGNYSRWNPRKEAGHEAQNDSKSHSGGDKTRCIREYYDLPLRIPPSKKAEQGEKFRRTNEMFKARTRLETFREAMSVGQARTPVLFLRKPVIEMYKKTATPVSARKKNLQSWKNVSRSGGRYCCGTVIFKPERESLGLTSIPVALVTSEAKLIALASARPVLRLRVTSMSSFPCPVGRFLPIRMT